MTAGVIAPLARLLVVDDSESNRYVIATWLRRAGYDVVEATTGTEALRALADQPIDLVVLDVNLPDMSGFSVCEQIKAEAATAAIPVLHLSATAVAATDRTEGLRRGAEGYLVEPVEPEEVLATVEALLRSAAAQDAAVRLARKLRQLNDATLAINEATTLEQLATTIARQAATLFEGAAIVAVVVEGRALSAAALSDDEVRSEFMTVGAVEAVCMLAESSRELAAESLPMLPGALRGVYRSASLHDDGTHRGVLLVQARSSEQHLAMIDEMDVVLSQYARAASTAIKNLCAYNIEHRIAVTLQKSLLPALPSISGLEIAVRYEASVEHAQVGGDFYEIFVAGANHVAFAIGDVVGHSLEAATVMAELRTGIRAYLLEGHDPVATLTHLNALLRYFHADSTATVCCGVLDRTTGACDFANAGHLPPLIVRASGVDFLPMGGSLLGIPSTHVHRYTTELQRGETLLLYTDGLVERRTEIIDEGLARLARVAAGGSRNLEDLCDRVLREAGPDLIVDDIALMALRRTS